MRVQTSNRAAVETKLLLCYSFIRVEEKTFKGAYLKSFVRIKPIMKLRLWSPETWRGVISKPLARGTIIPNL